MNAILQEPTRQLLARSDVVHSDASGAYVVLYPAITNRSDRDEFYAMRNSVRIGPYNGYRTLDDAIAGIARNDQREQA